MVVLSEKRERGRLWLQGMRRERVGRKNGGGAGRRCIQEVVFREAGELAEVAVGRGG